MKQNWTLPDTPFFADFHQQVVDRLNAWIAQNLERLTQEPEESLNEQCAYWLQSLAQQLAEIHSEASLNQLLNAALDVLVLPDFIAFAASIAVSIE